MLKKALLTIVVLLVIIIAAAFVLPFIFKDKLMAIAQEQINEQVNATVKFEDVGVSLFKNFPELTLSIYEVSVVNHAPFEGDTLAAIGTFSVSMDVMSVIKGETIQVNGFYIDKPLINVQVLEDGTANYDIAKETTSATEETESGETPPVSVSLKRYAINNGNIHYNDEPSELFASIKNLNHGGSGDFTLDVFDFKTKTTVDAINVNSGGVKYLSNAKTDLVLNIAVDLPNKSYTLNSSRLQINNLALGLDGNVKEEADSSYTLDLKFNAEETTFKSVLSLVPAEYLKDIEGIKADGKVALNGYTKGNYKDENYPAFGLDLKVAEAMMQYPDLPSAIRDINIDLGVKHPGGDLDNMVVNGKSVKLKMGEEPIALAFVVKTPMSDPDIDASFKGSVNLTNVKNYYPLGGDDLTGNLLADASFKGRLSALENEAYNRVQAKGTISIDDFSFKGESLPEGVAMKKARLIFATDDQKSTASGKGLAELKGNANLSLEGVDYTTEGLPPVTIYQMDMTLNPQKADLTTFKAKVGKSDLEANGELQDVLGYALSDDGMIKGKLNVKSNLLDLDELMGTESETTEETSTSDSTSSEEDFKVPANIDFAMNATVDKILYDGVEMTDASGKVTIRDETVDLSYLKVSLLDGTTTINGTYDTKGAQPVVDMGYDIKKISIKKAFDSFNTMEKLVPIGKYLTGTFSSKFTMQGNLTNELELKEESVQANGRLDIVDATIEGFKALSMLSEKLKIKQLEKVDLNNIWTVFEIKNGRMFLENMDFTFKEIGMSLSGSHGIDQSLDYKVKMTIPRKLLGKANNYVEGLLAKSPIPGLDASALPDKMNFNVGIGGTVENPKLNIGLSDKGNKGNLKETVKETVVNVVKDQTKDLREDAVKRAREEGEKLRQQAQRESEKIMNEARSQKNKLIDDAGREADKLINQAKNPIAKAAAKVAADRLKDQAKKKADDLMTKAQQRANKTVEDADNEAQRLVDEAEKVGQ